MPRSCSCIITHYYKSFKRASRDQENFMKTSREIQESFKGPQESFMRVLSGFQVVFKKVSRELLESF